MKNKTRVIMNPIQSSANNWLTIQRNQRISHRNNAVSFLGSALFSSIKKLYSLFSQKATTTPPRLVNLDAVLLEKIASYSGQNLRLLSKQFTREKVAFQCSNIEEILQANRHHVTTLDIHFGNRPTNALPTLDDIKRIATKMKHLKEIRISGRNVNNQLIGNVAWFFPGLTRLSISNSIRLTDKIVWSFIVAASDKKLTTLRLSSCPLISNEFLRSFRHSESPLKRLEITKCPQITKDGCENLIGLKKLTYLRMSYFPGIYSAFAELRKSTPSLQAEFEASGTHLVKAIRFVKEHKKICTVIVTAISTVVLVVLTARFCKGYYQREIIKTAIDCIKNIGLSAQKSSLCNELEDFFQEKASRSIENCIKAYRVLTAVSRGVGFSIPDGTLRSFFPANMTETANWATISLKAINYVDFINPYNIPVQI